MEANTKVDLSQEISFSLWKTTCTHTHTHTCISPASTKQELFNMGWFRGEPDSITPLAAWPKKENVPEKKIIEFSLNSLQFWENQNEIMKSRLGKDESRNWKHSCFYFDLLAWAECKPLYIDIWRRSFSVFLVLIPSKHWSQLVENVSQMWLWTHMIYYPHQLDKSCWEKNKLAVRSQTHLPT